MSTKPAVQDEDDIDISDGLVPHAHPTHKSGQVTAFDEDSGLPIVKRSKMAAGGEDGSSPSHSREDETRDNTTSDSGPSSRGRIPAHGSLPPSADRTGQQTSGSDSSSKRDILHKSTDRASLVDQAKRVAPDFEASIKQAIEGVKGAHFDAVRAEKTPERLTQKIEEEKQPVQTIPDILAGRVSVDTPEARQGAVQGIKDSFKVIREEDEFEKGSEPFGYRVHKLQVQVTPELSGEIHVVPKEVLEANDKTHEHYDDAREAELDGEDDTADKKAARAKAGNDAAMAKWNERNGIAKYKFGSTQANVPEDSDAHTAVKTAQDRVDDADLMGDGKDVDKPHVTVRYGIQSDDHAKLKAYLSKQSPFVAKLGKTTSFPPTPNSDGAAPIIAPVESPELHRMNAEIEQHGDFKKSDFPDYKPHVTVAYVKPEHAAKYSGMKETEGKTFHVKSVAISDRQGNHTEVPLGGKMDAGEDDGSDVSASSKRNSGVQRNRDQGNDTPNPIQPPESAPAGGGHPSSDGDRREDTHSSGSGPATKLTKGSPVTLPNGDRGTIVGGNPNFSSGGRWSVKTADGEKTFKGSDLKPAEAKDGGVIAVDLDGTLAVYHGFKSPTAIGAPIPKMVDRVKRFLANGENVVIFTARVDNDQSGAARKAIEAWCKKNLGQVLPVTNIKDPKIKSIFDDRAVQVERNEGTIMGSHRKATAENK